MRCMKKKRQSGKHTTPRRTVQLPLDWLAVAQEIAGDRQMPVMWYLIDLLKRDAEATGRPNLPAPPWRPGMSTSSAS